MARIEKPPEDKAKVKFRFVEFEMEGGSSSLEETIKSIAHAITRGAAVPVRSVGPAKTPSAGMLSADPPVNGARATEVDVEADLVQDEEGAGESVEEAREPSPRPKERKYRQPKFLDELDLDTDPSLRSFAVITKSLNLSHTR